MPINIGSIKPGLTISLSGELFIVVRCEHAKLGRGSAFCRAKLRNLKTGIVLEKTLRDSDNVEEAFIERRKLQYTYKDGGFFHFMDMETFEDFILDRNKIEHIADLLKENTELNGIFYDNSLINLELPAVLELKVKHTEPGIKGDSVRAGLKPAVLDTGAQIQVPLFINPGDIVKIDTANKEYLGRA